MCPNSIEHNKSDVNVSGFGICTDFKENPFLLKNREKRKEEGKRDRRRRTRKNDIDDL